MTPSKAVRTSLWEKTGGNCPRPVLPLGQSPAGFYIGPMAATRSLPPGVHVAARTIRPGFGADITRVKAGVAGFLAAETELPNPSPQYPAAASAALRAGGSGRRPQKTVRSTGMAALHRVARRETWQRFTLLDVLLVQASFGLSFSMACSLWPGEAGGVERVVSGTVWGLVFTGPITLLAQWTLRSRSRGLSAGEWLWLSPTVLFGLLACSLCGPVARFPELSRHLFSLWMWAQVTSIGAALAILFSGLRGYRSIVPCYWTDRAGTWASLLFGIWTFCFVLPVVLSG